MTWSERLLIGALAVAMIAVGVLHFVSPDPFVRIVPAYLPEPLLLVQVSGFFEIAGGVGLLIPRTRVAAAWGLFALFIAVFPANLNMAMNHIQPVPDAPVSSFAAWARLPFQLVLLAWAWRIARGGWWTQGGAHR
jgi:uncharacterized membrane protein